MKLGAACLVEEVKYLIKKGMNEVNSDHCIVMTVDYISDC